MDRKLTVYDVFGNSDSDSDSDNLAYKVPNNRDNSNSDNSNNSDSGDNSTSGNSGNSGNSDSSNIIDKSVNNYLNHFFDLTRIYREWRATQDEKSKETLSKNLDKRLHLLESDKCDIDSIQLYHDNNHLMIECHYNVPHSNNIKVNQYRIHLDDKVSINDEIKMLEKKINKLNYMYEVTYLRDNLLNYQSLNGTNNIDTYLLEIDFSLIDKNIIDKISSNKSNNPFERDIYSKLLELVTLKHTYDKHIDFLHNYKQLIHVHDKLFGKYRTCKNNITTTTPHVTIPNIELCLQYCQLRYADFLKALNTRHHELKLISKKEKNLRKAKIFDILALEKQISSLKSLHVKLIHKYNRGDLVKVEITPEIGELADDFLGFVKSYNDKKDTTNISYCNKVKNEELDTEMCKDVRNATFTKDNMIELVIPIVDFLHYYKNTISKSNKAISSIFHNKIQDIDDNESPDIPNEHKFNDKFEPYMVKSKEFTIQRHNNQSMNVNDKSYSEHKQTLFAYLYNNKEKLKQDIHKLCMNDDINIEDKLEDFITNYLNTVRKECPVINYVNSLEDYVGEYVSRYITFMYNGTHVNIKTNQVDDLRTQKERENEFESKRRELEIQLQSELEQHNTQDTNKGLRHTINHANRTGGVNNLSNNLQGQKGIRNVGSTCFMNSVLQIYSNMTPLREFLFSLRNNKYLNTVRNPTYKHQYNIINRFIDILSQLWKPGRHAVESGSILPFRKLIRSNFNIGREHDSGEFFIYMLNILNEYLFEPLNASEHNNKLPFTSVDILADGSISQKINPEDDNELLKSIYDSDDFINTHKTAINTLKSNIRKSIISHLYGIYIMHTISTYECENIENDSTIKIKYDINFILELKPGIEGQPVTIESLMSQFQQEEELVEGERVRSKICGHNYTHKTLKFVDLPPILNIKINRHIYTDNVMSKNITPINMPLVLDIEPLINENIYIGHKVYKYNLKSIIWHSGGIGHGDSEGYGHYVSWSKQHDKWIEFNDTYVSDADINTETINGQIYMKDGTHNEMQVHMVIYERQDLGIIKYTPTILSTDKVDKTPVDINNSSGLIEVVEDDVLESESEYIDDIEEPISEPEIISPKPISDPISEPKPISDPEVISPKPISDPEVISPKPISEPEIISPKPISDPEVISPKPISEPVYESLENSDDVEIIGENMNITDSSDDVEYDMVEVIIELNKQPSKNVPIVKHAIWLKDTNNTNIYYMANKDTSDPISLYMVYVKNENDTSDGTKVPINNIIYYYDENNTQHVYAYIDKFKLGDIVKDIENNIYKGTYKIKHK
jgi:ubiquitin C-terminal hydrolase